jgi:multiple sugar transport system permease protein
MVIFLAALKNVPRELYEVASLDGAGTVRQFFTITIPMISSATFFNVIRADDRGSAGLRPSLPAVLA